MITSAVALTVPALTVLSGSTQVRDLIRVVGSSTAFPFTEFDRRVKNGVTGIVEIKIDCDGVVIANTLLAPSMKLNLQGEHYV